MRAGLDLEQSQDSGLDILAADLEDVSLCYGALEWDEIECMCLPISGIRN